MKQMKCPPVCVFAFIAGLGLIVDRVHSQDQKDTPREKTAVDAQGLMPGMPDPAKMAEMMAKWQKTTVPGEHHKLLSAFVGEWDKGTEVVSSAGRIYNP